MASERQEVLREVKDELLQKKFGEGMSLAFRFSFGKVDHRLCSNASVKVS